MPYKDPEVQKQKIKEWVVSHPEKRAVTAHKYWQSEKGRIQKRQARLKEVFWTLETYDAALEHQRGLCAICGDPPREGRKLGADHDHLSHIPRALLCDNCNFLIGHSGDNPVVLEAAAEYLRKYGR